MSCILYRNLVYFIPYVRKTLNCVDYLTLLVAVLLSVSLSCTFRTLHHQLAVHDDTEDKSWSATGKRTKMWLLKLNLFFSAELKGLTEICKSSLVQNMEDDKTSYSNISIKLTKDFKSSGFTKYFHPPPSSIQICLKYTCMHAHTQTHKSIFARIGTFNVYNPSSFPSQIPSKI
jgi:hypothetical protein